jgi:hypothetical protein
MSHQPPEATRTLNSKSNTGMESDALLMDGSKEMRLFEHTLSNHTLNKELSRKLFAHSLAQQMKREGTAQRVEDILKNPILTQAAQEDYVKFTYNVMKKASH